MSNAPEFVEEPEISTAPGDDEPFAREGKESREKGCCCCCTTVVEAPKPVEYCTFEIWMSRVQVTQSQLADGKLELTLTGYADGAAVVHPSASTWIQVKKGWGWVAVNRLVKRITIPKGSIGYVQVSADATEWDMGFSGAAEIGTSDPVMLSMQCGAPPMTGIVYIDLKKIKNIGSGKGKVEVEFKIYQVS